MEKKIGKLVVAISIIAFAVSGVAQAQLGPITVPNFSFELDQDGNPRPWGEGDPGWAGTPDVTPDLLGWNDSDGIDSWSACSDGRQTTLEWSPDGFFSASMCDEEFVWQILTGEAISAGDEYLLTFNASGSQDDVHGSVHAALIYDDGGTLTDIVSELKETTTDCWGPGPWDEFTVSFTVPEGAAYIGQDLGIKLTSADSGWTHVDNVRLDLVPEPMTLALLGLGSLGLLRRRKI